jgi:NADH-quinone oxidoreductase subunit F
MSRNLSQLSFKSAGLRAQSQKPLFSAAVKTGAESFYDFTREENAQQQVHLCCGTSCLVAGRQEQVRSKLEEHFSGDEIGKVCCLGRCHENRSFMVQGRNYSGDDIERIDEIVQGRADLPPDSYLVSRLARELMLTAAAPDAAELYALAISYLDRPQALIDEVKVSRLRGRGGAGFPFHLKIASFVAAPGTPKYIVCNADEGDPGAFSDRYLLENQPHLVLFGMLVCGLATQAAEGILYIRHEYPAALAKVQAAINALKAYCSFPLRIVEGQGAYVCGEETALINSIEGQRPEVRVRPPYPTVAGLYDRPTLLSNVETFANLFWLLRQGGARYAQQGSADASGNKLVCLDSGFNRPGVYEVELGTPLERIFRELGEGFRTPLKAVQIGGPLGGIVPVTMIDKLTLDFASLQARGFILGHAGIVGIPETFPLIRLLQHLLEFAKEESCGKCYPCRLGTQRAWELVRTGVDHQKPVSGELLNELLWTLEHGSLCALGGGIALPVRNLLTHFRPELSQFIAFAEAGR